MEDFSDTKFSTLFFILESMLMSSVDGIVCVEFALTSALSVGKRAEGFFGPSDLAKSFLGYLRCWSVDRFAL